MIRFLVKLGTVALAAWEAWRERKRLRRELESEVRRRLEEVRDRKGRPVADNEEPPDAA